MPGLREQIEAERDRLERQIADLNRTLDVISLFESAASSASSRANGHQPAVPEAADKPRKRAARKPMTDAQRKRVSRRMRAYWKERRQSV